MEKYPLIVIGGGPAGFCAAVAAARLGTKTLLVEQYGILGGAITVGGVPYPMNFAAARRQVVAGIGLELIERLLRAGWARGKGKPPYGGYTVDIVMTACEIDRMIKEAGVELLLNCKLCEVKADDEKIISAKVAGPEGLIELSAERWIDATGDGQLSALAGADFEMGDPKTGELQPGSLSFWMDGYQVNTMDEEDIQEAYWQAREKGLIQVGDYYGDMAWRIVDLFAGHGLNKNHVEMQDVSAKSRTAASLEGRERIYRIMNWAKNDIKTTSGIYGAMICPEAWARETRRILGIEYVTADDYRAARKYKDGVCYSYYPIDVHKKPKEGEDAFFLERHTLSPNNVASIPLGAMIVRGFKNLMTAGRCISGDRLAQSAYRVQASCMAMGQAAGTAASLQAFKGEMLNSVDPNAVRLSLKSQGAIIPDIE
jgi:hypothetical protein